MPELVVTQRDGTQHTILYDDADAEVVEAHTWHVRAAPSRAGRPEIYYARTNTYKADGTRSTTPMHKMLTNRVHVTHINGNGLDNRRENLRLQRGNSQYRGLGWDAKRNMWMVRFKYKKKLYFGGRYYSEVQAAKVYDEEVRKIIGDSAPLNFPNEALGGPA